MKVAVVGAGIMGSCTALELVRLGHQVTVFEQFPLGHERGSSHGNSRIIRKAYPDAYFTKIMVEAYGLWHELEATIGQKLVYECGLLYFGDKDSSNMAALVEALRENGVEQNQVSYSDARALVPGLLLESNEEGYWTGEAGWVNAQLAVSGALAAAVRLGAEVRQERASVGLWRTGEFERIVWCIGSWSKEELDLPVTVTQQTFGYLSLPEPVGGSVWIDDHEHNVYGMPSEPGRAAIKFGVHSPGPIIDPDNPERAPDEASIDILHAFARRRFGIANPVIEDIKTCIYTRRETEDFLWGPLQPGTLYVSACSGHGFKFGPWIGRMMAKSIENYAPLEAYERFFY